MEFKVKPGEIYEDIHAGPGHVRIDRVVGGRVYMSYIDDVVIKFNQTPYTIATWVGEGRLKYLGNSDALWQLLKLFSYRGK